MWQRCSSQPPAANIVVAPMFAGEQRCHIDVTAEPPRRTSMRQRCSRAAPAPDPGVTEGSPRVANLRRRALLPPPGRLFSALSHDHEIVRGLDLAPFGDPGAVLHRVV